MSSNQNNYKDIDFGIATEFLDKLFNYLKKLNIDVSEFFLDHICYKMSSPERYHYLKKTLLHQGELLNEIMINGRPITTFKLYKPIIYKKRTIDILELPHPKPGQLNRDGFDHVEFVIDGSLQEFMEKYPDLQWNTSGIQKNIEGLLEDINPDISLHFPDMLVRFHLKPLEEVIRLEQKFINKKKNL